MGEIRFIFGNATGGENCLRLIGDGKEIEMRLKNYFFKRYFYHDSSGGITCMHNKLN